MIYKAGHKYIDLERVTAIEPIIWHDPFSFTVETKPDYKPIPDSIEGARIDCQLHEKPIEVCFSYNWKTPGDKLPEQQFDDLMAAWRSVVEKRNPQHHPKLTPPTFVSPIP